jgi:hypothetical protein
MRTGTERLRLYLPAHLQPVETGKHDVQNHRVGARCLDQLNTRGPIVRGLGFEPLGSKPIDDRVRDRALVLDHDDLLLHGGQSMEQ